MSKEMDFAQLVAQEEEIKLLKAESKRLREALTRISETLADVLDGSRVQEMQVRLGVQQDQAVALEAENKRLREALEARRGLAASQGTTELNSGDMLAFCGSPATSFPKG